MIIDAMDILYSGKVDGFCIVSSDSDFTRLAARLRESGMQVVGMGESKTPQPFISACNQFKYLDKLYAEKMEDAADDSRNEQDVAEGADSTTDIARVNRTIKSIIKKFSNDDGWIFSGKLGDQLSKRLPDFDVRNYGYSKLTLFMKSLGGYDIHELSIGKYQKQIYFRIREKPTKKKTVEKTVSGSKGE